MRTMKRVAAGALALMSAISMAACGSSSSGNSSSFTEKVKVSNTDEIKAIPSGKDNTLEWYSYFDINPTKASPEKRTDLALFEKKGGKIKYVQVPSTEKYEKLASRLLSNDPPDMFWYEQKMTFPANCVKGMFQPIDDLVDFSSSMWKNDKEVADQFALNGKHYVAPIKYLPNSVLTYNKETLQAAGLDDPYTLYTNGKWDWNTWYDMMDSYCKGAKGNEERYGVNGWIAPFIFQSTGKTLIQYDKTKDEYVSNLDDADFVRASDLLYKITKNNYYYGDWVGQASDAFKKNILFFAMGPWASQDTHTPKKEDNWGVVPMPKDPNNDKQYVGVDINAYMWVKGSTKNEAMKCWLECAKIVNTQQSYIDVDKKKFFVNNPYWTEDMYKATYEDAVSTKYSKLIDPGYGISTKLSDDNAATNDSMEALNSYMYSSVMKTDDNGTQYTWTQLREKYKATFASELKTFNESYHKFIGK